MIDAQRIELLRQEFGYHADIAFATAEATGNRRRHQPDYSLFSRPAPATDPLLSRGTASQDIYALT